MATAAVDTAKLEAILLAQSDKAKARYAARNPMETITFFGLEPGMKIGEALPGGAGWYSKILIPYLGPEGKLVGIDYDFAMWPEFSFATEDFMKTKETWPEDWSAKAREWSPTEGAEVSATTFGREDVAAGSLDAVLFIRAMHNLSRFENEGAYLTKALANTHRMLKAGGMVGVVQHAGPETNEDSWATGSNGYLKRSDVIAAFDAAGFDLVAESDINANPRDVPSNTDGVWRLPPSLSGAEEGSELRAQREAIGESNRMTLKFRKR
jgi:predicted methyltransferase